MYRSDDETEMSTGAYWDRLTEQASRDAAEAKAYAATPSGKVDSLRRKIAGLRLDQVDNGADHVAEIATAEAEVAEIVSAAQAASEAARISEWTPEVTVARRSEWNAAVAAGEFTGRDGKINWSLVRAWERGHGWTHEALQAAVKSAS